MSERKKQRRIRYRKFKKAPPGSAPGMLSVSEDAEKPVVKVTSYTETEIEHQVFTSAEGILNHIRSKQGFQHWVEIKGFGDKQFFEDLSAVFNIHRLEMEDVLSGHQRPKLEESEGHLFIISRPISYSTEDEIQDDQLSIFI